MASIRSRLRVVEPCALTSAHMRKPLLCMSDVVVFKVRLEERAK